MNGISFWLVTMQSSFGKQLPLEWNMIEQIWNNAESLREFIFSVLHDSHQDLRARFCTILWAIWECRNKKLWEDIGKAPHVDRLLPGYEKSGRMEASK